MVGEIQHVLFCKCRGVYSGSGAISNIRSDSKCVSIIPSPASESEEAL
jgi:hypothetical protein